MRSRLFMPNPQVTLQGSHSAHSVTTQLLGAVERTKMFWFMFEASQCQANHLISGECLKILSCLGHSYPKKMSFSGNWTCF